MESIIEHSCYTFIREIFVWETYVRGKKRYLQSHEVSDDIKHSQKAAVMALDRTITVDKTQETIIRPIDKLDLKVTEAAYQECSRRYHDPVGQTEGYLNSILLKKLQSLSPSEAPVFLARQMELYLQRGGDPAVFIDYTKQLLESNPQPWTIKYKGWIEKNNPKEKEDIYRKNQASARQLVLCFKFLSRLNYFKRPARDIEKIARFYSFLSGLAPGTISKKLGMISERKVKNVTEKKEVEFLQKDLKRVYDIFSDCGYEEPAKEILSEIEKLEKKKLKCFPK